MATWTSNGADIGGSGSYVAGTQSVQYIHDNFAASGDTIVVPSGGFTWLTGVVITKSVTISGSGFNPNPNSGGGANGGAPAVLPSKITFNAGGTGQNGISLQAGNSGQLMRLSGLSLTLPNASNVLVAASGIPTGDYLRIDNCFLDGGSNQVVLVNLSGNQRGLIDHCTLSGGAASELIHNLGLGPGSLSGWQDDIAPGSDKMMVCEDCIFQVNNYNDPSGIFQFSTSALQAYYGARTCIRFCLMRYLKGDAHGNVDVNSRWFEFYNNQFYCPPNQAGQSFVFDMRGGSGVIWGNTIMKGVTPTYPPVIRLYTDEAVGNNLSPAVGGPQPGYGPGAGIFTGAVSPGPSSSPVYLWGNDAGMVVDSSNVGVGNWSPSPIAINQNYFVSASQPASMQIRQTAAQNASGGATYSYTPYAYPHPLSLSGGVARGSSGLGRATAGTSVPANSLVTPGGSQGIQGLSGTAGPSSPSADPNNLLTSGSDSLLYLPPSAIQPTIWSARLRSFSSVGNPSFEVDQRQVHAAVGNPANNIFSCDRWFIGRLTSGGAVVNTQSAIGTGVTVPGTNFKITSTTLNLVLATPQATLAAGEYFVLNQFIEGSVFRELASDVHSVSILCYSTVANLKFALVLRDASAAYSLVKLCTIPNANTPTLIQLPNLPLWTSSGTFNQVPGQTGYILSVCLACGSTYMAPAADTWQTGNFFGAPGMSNWLASSANSYFVLQFIQHEPGPQCTTLIDKPFSQNLDECLRYYQKSIPFTVAPPPGANTTGVVTATAVNATLAVGTIPFKKIMAKVPTVTLYNASNSGVGQIWDYASGTGIAATPYLLNESGFSGFNASAMVANQMVGAAYTADTGW